MSNPNRLSRLAAGVALVALSASIAVAQGSGSITGLVKDTSGGTLPGATVTVVNVATEVPQTALTDVQGQFQFPQLPPGPYRIVVELQGFKRVEKRDVVLSTATRLNVGDFVLDVGAMTETITVAAEAGRLQIQTESAERSDLVTNTQLRDLALNGRNIGDLFKTIPGVIAGGTQTTSTVANVVGSFNINGTRNNQHEYTVDGVTNLNLGNNTGALVSINPDALEEVKILTSNYQAEFGKAGGGFIALTTRSGTNRYRGGLRYFKRHESLNANSFFNNATDRPKPLYRYDYSGWDFGGPLPIGGTRESRRMFFFAAQEYYQQKTPAGAAQSIRVPTALERGGDFSQTRDGNGNAIAVRDPLTGQPFPNNTIPSSRFAPGMRALLDIFPQPNAPEGGALYNYTSQLSGDIPRREDIFRFDWQAAATTRLSVRYIHNKDEDFRPYGTTTAAFNFPLSNVVRKNGPGTTLSATVTHAFGPSLVNELVYGLGRGGVFIGPVDDLATRASHGVDVPLLFGSADPDGILPSVAFGGVANQTFANTNFNGTPFDQKFIIHNVYESLTKMAGRHSFKGGFFYQHATNRRTSFGPVQANLAFGATHPQNTGHPFANALLGLFDTYTQAEAKITSNYVYQNIEGYLQDTWKIRPHLTLDYGLRLSHYQPIYDQENRLGFFNPDLYDPAQAVRLYRPVCVTVSPCAARAIDPAISTAPTVANTQPANYVGTIVPNSGNLTNGIGRAADGYAAGGFTTAPVLWGPRLGFAWDVRGDRRAVVRGGFGITYDRIDTDRVADAITNPPGIQVATLSNGTISSLATAGRSDIIPVNADVVGWPEDGKVPTVYSYSIGVQKDIGWDMSVDIAYVGTQSRHNPRQTDLNAVPYGAMFLRENQDPTRYNGTVPAVEPTLPAAHAAAGLPFSGATPLNVNLLRPYAGYGSLRSRLFDSKASFNSLQASVQRRFSRNLSFGASYTLSQAKTDSAGVGDATSPFDLAGYDYALANFDRTHYFVVNYVWNVPAGSRLLGGGLLARGLLDNWTLSGISWISSGNPAEMGLSISGINVTNRLLGTDSGGQAGDLQPRFRVQGDPQGAPDEIALPAIQVPGIGDRGPYDRFYLRNPGFNNHDLSVFKNFPLPGGNASRYFQFRLEMFNVFNHTQFSGVNRTTNLTNGAGQTGAAILNDYTNLAITNNLRPAGATQPLGTFFGEYNAVRDPRIIQVGVKLYF
jgi:Carboxypeptidase regulatory-like domain/TonB-dependent Receptor Plug Domain